MRQPSVHGSGTSDSEEFLPEWSHPPGALLQAELDARGMTQSSLAARASLSPKHVNQVVKGTAPLSPDVALALDRALGIPAVVWLRAEANWQAAQSLETSRTSLKGLQDWVTRFPRRILDERGITAATDDIPTAADRLLRFFQVSDDKAFDKVWLAPAASYKRSQSFEIDPRCTAIWIRLAEREASRLAQNANHFSPKSFRSAVHSLTAIAKLPIGQGFKEAQRLFLEAGVVLVFIPEIKGTRISGVSRQLSTEHHMIAVTNRYRYLDSVWFSIAHESGHVLLHPRRATYLDFEGQADDNQDSLEDEANTFAQSILMPERYRAELQLLKTAAEIKRFADRTGISPAIAAGQYGYITNRWSTVSGLRTRVNLSADLVNAAGRHS